MITNLSLGKMGRLGNQMFQFAALRSLAINNSYILKIPIQKGYYGDKGGHLLDIFQIEVEELKEEDHSKIPYHYEEPHFHFSKNYFVTKDGTDIRGYFQSEKYFSFIKDTIRKDYSFKKEIIQRAVEIKPDVVNLVSVHVRRGDYLKFPKHHPLCTMEYYKKAMSFFEEANFLFFSDDVGWCEDNFKGDQYLFAKDNSDGVDLALMTLCDHNIIANSSFSWWGAWLNANPFKIIIAPEVFVGPALKNMDVSDVHPADWKKI